MKSIAPIVLTLLIAWPAFAQTGTESVLTVSGNGEVRVEPDLATVRLGIVGQAETDRVAQDAANLVGAAILDAHADVGVDDDDIQTAGLNLTPFYRRIQVDGEPEIIGYRASNTVSVRVTDVRLVGGIIDAGLEAGANQLQGVSFGLQDDLAAREEALRMAIAEARRKAEAMANALGANLAGVLRVNEGGVFVQQPVMEMGARAMAAQQMVPTPVAPGSVSVSASVSIEYRISPR
jgi:uncharacterized protein YggE